MTSRLRSKWQPYSFLRLTLTLTIGIENMNFFIVINLLSQFWVFWEQNLWWLGHQRVKTLRGKWGILPHFLKPPHFLLLHLQKELHLYDKNKRKTASIKSINSLMRYQCSVARSKFLWKLFPLQLDVQDLLCQPKLLARCGQFKKEVTKQEQFAHVWQAITQGNPTFKQGGKTHTPHTYQNTCQLTVQPARKYWHLFKRTCPHKQNHMPRIKERPKV